MEKKLVNSPLLQNTATSLPGVVAETVLESTSEYNSVNDEAYNDPNSYDGYLVPKSKLITVLIPLYLLSFMSSMDATLLSTLMTDIASDLNGIPYISWIATSYLLSTCIVQPLGKLSDIFGRKQSMLFCILIFTLGCWQCANSTSVVSFASGRFLSGFAAGLNTLVAITTSDLVPLRSRGVYQGLGNIFFALGSTVGGTAGGWIAQKWGWRVAFWFQVPLGVLSFLIIGLFFDLPTLPHEVAMKNASLSEKMKKIDLWGILLIAFNLFIFIILTSSKLNGSTITALVLVLSFGLYCLYRVEINHSFPLVPFELLSDSSVLGCVLANWFGNMYSYSLLYYFPVYLSTVKGLDSASVGLRGVPNILAGSLSSIATGVYMRWKGKYRTFSIIVQLLGIIGLSYLLFRTQPGKQISTYEEYFMGSIPLAAYVSMITVTLLALIASVPYKYQSSVTSLQYSFRSIGSTLGTSISSFLFTSSLSAKMTKALAAAKPSDVPNEELQKVLSAALHDAKYIRSPQVPEWSIDALVYSYNFGCWIAFIFCFAGCVAGFACICMIKESKLHANVNRN